MGAENIIFNFSRDLATVLAASLKQNLAARKSVWNYVLSAEVVS